MCSKAPMQSVQPLLWLLIGSVCISFAPIFIKLANVSPDSAAFYRMLFAGLSLFLLLKLKRTSLLMHRKAFVLLILGGISLSADFMCWHRSIHYVGPGFSTLLGNLQVFFTALFSCLLFKEKLHRNLIIAILVALTGLLFITGGDINALSDSDRLGILFGIGTALFYSGYILLIKSAMNYEEVNGVAAMFIVSVCCTVFFSIITPAMGASFAIPDRSSLLALIGAGVVCTTIGWSFISSAIKLTSATIASLFLLLQPALAFVWDVLFFSRPTASGEIFGVCLVLSAIYIGSYRRT
jgi:drug/metabolite transporter (DMT)-like permease